MALLPFRFRRVRRDLEWPPGHARLCDRPWHRIAHRPGHPLPNWPGLTNTPASNGQFKKRAERFDGRAAMVEIVIGVVVEGLIGLGIVHLIGLGALGDGYCRMPHPISALLFLNFCFLISQRNQRAHRGESAALAVLDSF